MVSFHSRRRQQKLFSLRRSLFPLKWQPFDDTGRIRAFGYIDNMAKKSKKSRGSNEDGGAAVTLLSLSNIAKEVPSTAEGLEDGGGPNVPGDDSDAFSPPEVPDLCIPSLNKEKKKKKKKMRKSSVTVDVGLSGAENGEDRRKKRKSSVDTIDPGRSGEAKSEKKRKKQKVSGDTVDPGLTCEGEEETKKRTSSSDTNDARPCRLERKEKKKRRSSSDSGDRGLNDEEKIMEKKIRRKKRNAISSDVEVENASGQVSNGDMDADVGEGKQDMRMGLSEDSGVVLKKKTKRKLSSDDAGLDTGGRRNPAGRTELNEGISEGGGAVAVSKRKKTVRFQEPSLTVPEESVPDENVTHVLPENTEDDIEYFSENRNWKKDLKLSGLLYGKFSEEEDEKLKSSVFDYIKMRGWSDEGLKIVLHSSQHAAIARGCWLEIAKCLPSRPVKQIHSRAIRLLGGHKRGKWSDEELEVLKNLHKIHGNNWKKIASHMDRSSDVCKDKWRHFKILTTRVTGPWKQDELDMLCKLVRRCLKVKASVPSKDIDRRELRDDISWEYISEQLQRDSSVCADVWYNRLASTLISAKKWANGDDRLLLQRLMEIGAASEEALDWETILDHRGGELCSERWKEMTKLLGKSDNVSFEEKLELLAKRYAPDLVGIEEQI